MYFNVPSLLYASLCLSLTFSSVAVPNNFTKAKLIISYSTYFRHINPHFHFLWFHQNCLMCKEKKSHLSVYYTLCYWIGNKRKWNPILNCLWRSEIKSFELSRHLFSANQSHFPCGTKFYPFLPLCLQTTIESTVPYKFFPWFTVLLISYFLNLTTMLKVIVMSILFCLN